MPRPQVLRAPSDAALRALESADAKPFWLDDAPPPPALPVLSSDSECELLVVGGGFMGLWTALKATERRPGADVKLIEASGVGLGAASRNGGMLLAGWAAYPSVFTGEEQAVTALEYSNHTECRGVIERLGIDCDLQASAGELWTATRTWQVEALAGFETAAKQVGKRAVSRLSGEETRARVNSPTYQGGVLYGDDALLVQPAKLAWGLRAACLDRGVEIFENTQAIRFEQFGERLITTTQRGRVTSSRIALCTYTAPSLLAPVNRRRVPTYSHILVTEPLSDRLWQQLRWHGNEAVVSTDPRFFYYRPTADGRILWGWVDGTVPRGLVPSPTYDQLPEVFGHMATEFFETFPQLTGVRFTHAWGGALDVSSRRAPFFTVANRGRVVSANGFTGGVAGSHFAADVMLDILAGVESPRTRLGVVADRPPTRRYPPPAVMHVAAPLVLRSMARQQDDGRADLYLRAVRRLGFRV